MRSVNYRSHKLERVAEASEGSNAMSFGGLEESHYSYIYIYC